MKKAFNWDKFYSTAKWDEIRQNSPLLSSERLPSLINKDQEIAYFSSIDLDCSLNDKNGLETFLELIKQAFLRALKSNYYYKAACAESDFYTAQSLLTTLGFPNDDALE